MKAEPLTQVEGHIAVPGDKFIFTVEKVETIARPWAVVILAVMLTVTEGTPPACA